jgi:iduronate 2-sulfatase
MNRLTHLLVWLLALGSIAQAANKPNILFIAVDDLRPELGTYGTRARTPHIDRLAASGLQFDRAYCNQAVCGASRVSLMTGLYPEYTGERTYHVTGWRKRWPHIVTLNQHFKANGYTTIGLGKIYHGTGGVGVDPDNWSEWVKVSGKGYCDPKSLKGNNVRERNGRRRGPSTESADVADDIQHDGVRAREGAARIHKLAKGGRPFFLAVGFTKPHLPFIAPKKYWDLYDRNQFKMPPNTGIPPGYPSYARNLNAGELRSYSDIPLKGTPADFPDALNRKLIHGYHACVSYMDRNVGVLLEALEASGASQNTIVVFWADHGWKLGDHTSWCKHTNFECDNRVPLIIRHPKIAAAKGKSNSLVELVDLYPTLCELTGLDRPKHLQGKSLVPVLKNPSAEHRDSAYSSYPHGSRVGHSIRTAQYRYTEWWDKKTGMVLDAILTNIETDPGETTAVSGQTKLKAEMSAMLKQRVLSVRKR